MSDTILHELCKGFGALLTRSKTPGFAEETARRNERGNLPLHAACSFQPTPEVVELLIKAYPDGPRVTNNIGNLPIHQAAMWQASVEVVELLLERHPDGAATRNQYGSLPLHMAASNQVKPEVVKRLIDVYPEALHIQNDDGMTPLDLCLADESASEQVVAMLEGRPPPPELTQRQQAEKYQERGDAIERKLGVFRDSSGRQRYDLQLAILCIRRLADNIPHALYSAGIDPNELEMALSHSVVENHGGSSHRGGGMSAEDVILDMIKKIQKKKGSGGGGGLGVEDEFGGESSGGGGRRNRVEELMDGGGPGGNGGPGAVRDRVEDLLDSIVGLEHIKSQIRGLRRTTEISDLLESISPNGVDEKPRASHMIFVGNPGTGKTTVGRLLAKIYHELGILRKPKFLQVERLDLVARSTHNTIIKTREVIDEARGGILFIDEAYTLSLSSNRRGGDDCGSDAIAELISMMDKNEEDFPLVILAGFPEEMYQFVRKQDGLRCRFPLMFQFPDYTCEELAMIFADLSHAKGFDLSEELTEDILGKLLSRETSQNWRSDRNGRVSEALLSGARTQVRMRMRAGAFEETEVDPSLIILDDVENVIANDFK